MKGDYHDDVQRFLKDNGTVIPQTQSKVERYDGVEVSVDELLWEGRMIAAYVPLSLLEPLSNYEAVQGVVLPRLDWAKLPESDLVNDPAAEAFTGIDLILKFWHPSACMLADTPHSPHSLDSYKLLKMDSVLSVWATAYDRQQAYGQSSGHRIPPEKTLNVLIRLEYAIDVSMIARMG